MEGIKSRGNEVPYEPTTMRNTSEISSIGRWFMVARLEYIDETAGTASWIGSPERCLSGRMERFYVANGTVSW